MPDNELILIDQVLAHRQAERDAPLPADRAFELFACEQALRDADLTSEEIEDGVVGGGNDGAIDGAYVFLGEQLLREDAELYQDDFSAAKVSKGARLRLWLIQAKRDTSFTETALDLVESSAQRLLNLSESEEDLRRLYSDQVVERVMRFRRALTKLATRHPQVEVTFTYATRGRVGEVNAKVAAKARDLEQRFASLTAGGVGSVEFLGAAELWKRANTVPSYTVELPYRKNATSGTSHVALVSLRDYVEFLTDEIGTLRRHIFDWNVRDYQGEVEVNREIRESILSTFAPEFWWLNNGVTMVCSKATTVGEKYILDDVQIVNGLQTSHTIYDVLREVPDDHPAHERSVLVRILVTDDPATRDQVIRATNRQTTIQPASLRATDDIQRSIEAYFSAHEWYYDRRKNYYRNMGKSPERIVSIPLLAQAVMAMGMGRPDNSRARPSSLLKRDDDYKKIFSENVPLATYLWLAKSQKAVDSFLLSEDARSTPQERTNLRFYLAMLAAMRLFGARIYSPAQLTQMVESGREIHEADLPSSLAELREYFALYVESTGYTAEKTAKGSEFVTYAIDWANARLRSDAETVSADEV